MPPEVVCCRMKKKQKKEKKRRRRRKKKKEEGKEGEREEGEGEEGRYGSTSRSFHRAGRHRYIHSSKAYRASGYLCPTTNSLWCSLLCLQCAVCTSAAVFSSVQQCSSVQQNVPSVSRLLRTVVSTLHDTPHQQSTQPAQQTPRHESVRREHSGRRS